MIKQRTPAPTRRRSAGGLTGYVRFNTPTQGIQIDSIPASDWTVHPDGDDVAVVPLDLESSRYDLSAIPIDIFMTEDQRMNGDFGAGDECFVVGRNIGLEGQNRNTPAARFGAVSMIDPEPIYQEERHRCQESLVVEAKSLGGYSGAPVFVYQSPPILEPVRAGMEKWSVVVHSYSQAGFAMLGITFGHIAGRSAITGPWHDLAASERAVAVNSGMMLVVPAWKIREILDLPRFVELREKEEGDQADRPVT